MNQLTQLISASFDRITRPQELSGNQAALFTIYSLAVGVFAGYITYAHGNALGFAGKCATTGVMSAATFSAAKTVWDFSHPPDPTPAYFRDRLNALTDEIISLVEPGTSERALYLSTAHAWAGRLEEAEGLAAQTEGRDKFLAYRALGIAYHRHRNHEAADRAFRGAVEGAESAPNTTARLCELARDLVRCGRHEQVEEVLRQALDSVARSLDTDMQEKRFCGEIFAIHAEVVGDVNAPLTQGIIELLERIALGESDPLCKSEAFADLALIAHKMGHEELSKRRAASARLLVDEIRDIEGKCIALVKLAKIHVLIGNRRAASKTLQRALTKALSDPSPRQQRAACSEVFSAPDLLELSSNLDAKIEWLREGRISENSRTEHGDQRQEGPEDRARRLTELARSIAHFAPLSLIESLLEDVHPIERDLVATPLFDWVSPTLMHCVFGAGRGREAWIRYMVLSRRLAENERSIALQLARRGLFEEARTLIDRAETHAQVAGESAHEVYYTLGKITARALDFGEVEMARRVLNDAVRLAPLYQNPRDGQERNLQRRVHRASCLFLLLHNAAEAIHRLPSEENGDA